MEQWAKLPGEVISWRSLSWGESKVLEAVVTVGASTPSKGCAYMCSWDQRGPQAIHIPRQHWDSKYPVENTVGPTWKQPKLWMCSFIHTQIYWQIMEALLAEEKGTNSLTKHLFCTVLHPPIFCILKYNVWHLEF